MGHRSSPVELCCLCRRGAKPLTVHRAQLIPFWHRVLDAPRFPFGLAGVLSLVVLGFVQALTSYVGLTSMMMMGGAVFMLRQGLFWAFLFFIIRSSAEGANRMGVLGLRDIQSDVITPALKGILSTALLWLPAAIYIALVSGDGVLGILSYEGYKDPVVWLLVLLGILYAPMALLAAATDLGFLEVLNPVRIFTTIARMGRDYFVAIAAVAVVVAFGRMVDYLLGGALAHVGLPFLPRWVGATVGLYAPFVAARILGVLLYTRGEALDWGRSEDYQVSVMPGVRPRGVLPEKPAVRAKDVPREVAAPEADRAKPEPRSIPLFDPQVAPAPGLDGLGVDDLVGGPALELAPHSEAQPPLQPGPQDIDLPGLPLLAWETLEPPPPRPALLASSTLPPLDLPILDDLDGLDLLEPPPPRLFPTASQPASSATVRGFAPVVPPGVSRAVSDARSQPQSPAPALDPGATVVGHASTLVEHDPEEEALMAHGKAAAKARDFEGAARAFGKVASAQSEQAGAALVSLAQVVGDGQKDLAKAKQLYQEAVRRFPGTDAAAYAERRLTALGR